MTTICEPFTPVKERWISKNVKPQKVMAAVADYFEIDVSEIMNRRRFHRLTFPRFVIYKILYRHSGLTQEELGEIFGMDRTSVIYGITALTGWMDVYPEIKSEFENIEKLVLNEVPN